jgi:hypothetical protein
MPLTMAQLERLSLPVLVARLIHSRHHLLALRICAMLGLPSDQVDPAEPVRINPEELT